MFSETTKVKFAEQGACSMSCVRATVRNEGLIPWVSQPLQRVDLGLAPKILCTTGLKGVVQEQSSLPP